ncbi:MAG: hypothetical protein ABH838_02475 [Actinomycetota bacterium]
MRQPEAVKPLAYTAAVLGAAAGGFLALNLTDLFPVVAFILGAGVVIGIIWPNRAWVYGFILGLGVPFAHLLAPGLGYVRSGAQPNIWATFITILPGVLGTASGVMLRYAFIRGKSEDS